MLKIKSEHLIVRFTSHLVIKHLALLIRKKTPNLFSENVHAKKKHRFKCFRQKYRMTQLSNVVMCLFSNLDILNNQKMKVAQTALV